MTATANATTDTAQSLRPTSGGRGGGVTARATRSAAGALVTAAFLVAPGAVAVPSASATTSAGAGTSTAAVPTPAVPAGLPSAIEATAPYEPQTSCDPVVRKGTSALGQLLVRTYPGTSFGGIRPCGADGGTSASEHYEGRAVDWMVDSRIPAQKAEADAAIAWLLAPDAAGNRYAMARRLGVMYIIWNKQIFGLYRPADGWRPYRCSGVTSCHQDHVHLSLTWNGATGRTSFWTGRVSATDYGPCKPMDLNWAPRYAGVNPTPCPSHAVVPAPAGASALVSKLVAYSGAVVRRGQTGPVVAAVQSDLGVTPTGTFGSLTQSAVTRFQTSQGLAGSGVVDSSTWRALLRQATPMTPSVPATESSPASKPPATTSPLRKYRSSILRKGSRGAAVAAVQRTLHVRTTGFFGPLTYAAVVRFQHQHHLPATGVVAAKTWRALGA